jgi:hypothetical protein
MPHYSYREIRRECDNKQRNVYTKLVSISGFNDVPVASFSAREVDSRSHMSASSGNVGDF